MILTIQQPGFAIKYVIKDGVQVSENCTVKCQALSALKTRHKVIKIHKDKLSRYMNSVGHPASQLCFQLGGTNILEKNDHGNERDICRFSDQSRIASWDLYQYHNDQSAKRSK